MSPPLAEQAPCLTGPSPSTDWLPSRVKSCPPTEGLAQPENRRGLSSLPPDRSGVELRTGARAARICGDMIRVMARIALFLTAFGSLALAAAEPTAAREHSTDPMDWLIQHICADTADKPVPADPYDGCPAGTHERRLKIGDPMPYLRHDMPGRNGSHPLGFQRHDAYPLVDLHYGGIFSANDYDFGYSSPYGRFEPGDGDGFDVYRVWRGYATGGGTRDGAGYSQSFFGPECKPFGGWVFFPVSFLKDLKPGAEGSGVFPIRGDYWEQKGETWPGRCEPGKGFSTTQTTQWSFEPSHRFGGVNGAKTKIIDAIVSTHGLPVSPTAQPHFHLERFYFTDMYGLTRWEVWYPKGEKDAKPSCADNPEMSFHGIGFVETACRDWSATEIFDPPLPRFPWPYPERDLLTNWHFGEDALAPWRSEASAHANHPLELKLGSSNTTSDTRFAPRGGGVRFLHVDCVGGCAGDFGNLPRYSDPTSRRREAIRLRVQRGRRGRGAWRDFR